MIIGTNHFVSYEKAVNYYSRPVPASSNRDIRAEVDEKISAGEIVIGAPVTKLGQALLVIDNGTRYAIEDNKPWTKINFLASAQAPGLFDEVKARGIPYSNHYSDLYVPVTNETTILLHKYGHKKANRFVNQVEGGLWYDVPFAYTPFWEEKQKRV